MMQEILKVYTMLDIMDMSTAHCWDILQGEGEDRGHNW